MNLSGSWAGIPVWTLITAWLLSCAIRGWVKGFWHQLACPLALFVFVGLHFLPMTDRLRLVSGGALMLSLLVFRGWKWLSTEWPQTNDEPSFWGRQLLGFGGSAVSVLTGLGFLWLVLVGLDALGLRMIQRPRGTELYHIAKAGIAQSLVDLGRPLAEPATRAL